MENDLDYCIQKEEFVCDTLATQIKFHQSNCIECDQRAFLYHKAIIGYLKELKELRNQ